MSLFDRIKSEPVYKLHQHGESAATQADDVKRPPPLVAPSTPPPIEAKAEQIDHRTADDTRPERTEWACWKVVISMERPFCQRCSSSLVVEFATRFGIKWSCWTCNCEITPNAMLEAIMGPPAPGGVKS